MIHLAESDDAKRARKWLYDPILSHNDLLSGNILYLSKSKEIKFVDFEYGTYSYRGFDIANHFNEISGFDCNYKKWDPSKEAKLRWLKIYKSGPEESEKFWDEALRVINDFILVDHFFWGLWGVVQAKHSPIDFDFMEYAYQRLEEGYRYHLEIFYLNHFLTDLND